MKMDDDWGTPVLGTPIIICMYIYIYIHMSIYIYIHIKNGILTYNDHQHGHIRGINGWIYLDMNRRGLISTEMAEQFPRT